jgi:hypothetical protein
VLFGNRRIPGTIAEILPVSGVYAGTPQPQVLTRDRPATQIARVRFAPDALPPPLNSTVYVHMHYTKFSAWAAKCPSEDFLIPLNHLDSMEPILIRGGAYIVDGQEPGEVRPRSLEISERPD